MAVVALAQQTAITNLYIGLFNRAPDASGLQFWAQALADGAPLSAITGSFLGSPESQAIYTPAQTSAQFVTSFYQTVFGRAPDTSGLAFWTSVLNDAGGTGSAAAKAMLVLQIVGIVSTPLPTKPAGLSDAQYAETVKDRDIFSKKVAVGIDFAVVQKGNDMTAAKTLVAAVTTPVVPTTPTTPAVLDQVIALTIADETKTGGAGNDTFNAPMIANVQTLNTGDILDGGAGTDTLNAELRTSSFVTPTLTSIEIVKVKVVSSNGGLRLANAAGVTQAGFDGSTVDGDLYEVGTVALSVSNQSVNASFSGITATALSLSLNSLGTPFITPKINLNDSLATTHNIVANNAFVEFLGNADVVVNAVTVNATGINKLMLSASDAGTVTSLSVSGTGWVNFADRALSALTSFVGTGSGNITLTTTTATVGVVDIAIGSGADTIVANGASIKTLNTGAGIDTVTLNTGALSAAAVVNLGDGNDTITLARGSVSGAVVNGGNGNDTFITGAVTQTVAGVLAAIEAVTMTGAADLAAGQAYTVAGLTFTSNAVTTQAQLLAAFASLTNGAVTGAGSALGVYSGALSGYSTGAVTSNSVLFSATSSGDKLDLAASGTGAAAANIVVTQQGATAVTAVVGSVDTLTGGTGNDVFSFNTADVNTTAGAVTAIITDFQTGADQIRVTMSGTNWRGSESLVKGGIFNSLAELLTAANTALTGTNFYYVGQFGTDSYLVTDLAGGNGHGYTNVIKLVGVAVANGIVGSDLIGTALP